MRDIVMPIGISFFTFQQIACCVAVYSDLLRIGFVDYVAYITYFPKLLMGPLMDPIDFVNQINDKGLKKINYDHLAGGIKIFCFGFAILFLS